MIMSRKYVSSARYDFGVVTFNSDSDVEWLQGISPDSAILATALDNIEPEEINPSAKVDMGIVLQNLMKGPSGAVLSDGVSTKAFIRCIVFYSRTDQVELHFVLILQQAYWLKWLLARCLIFLSQLVFRSYQIQLLIFCIFTTN